MANVRCLNSRRGIALIELAIGMILLLALTFAVIEYGWVFLKSHHIANAARQGARVGARPDATAGDVTNAVATAMTNGGLGSSGYSVVMVPNDPGSLNSGETFTVTVSVDYSNVELGFPLVPKPATLESEMVMAKEGP